MELKSSLALLSLCLAACSSVADVPSDPGIPPDATMLPAVFAAIAGAEKLPEPLEISAPRLAHPISPSPWIICLRSGAPDQSRRYANFFKDGKHTVTRLAVLIDRCGKETYSPLSK
jgi:hypothetical protein